MCPNYSIFFIEEEVPIRCWGIPEISLDVKVDFMNSYTILPILEVK